MSVATVDLKVPVCKLVCGGMHTVAIAPSGAVFTWGCNDEGALGRPGIEDKPILVSSLTIRCTDASAGDSHTVFYNTDLSQAFFTGLYRVSRANFHLGLERTIRKNM
jgi:regulator of chromosome condensation